MSGYNCEEPELSLKVLEVQGLKHDGAHAFDVSFMRQSRISRHIDGLGSFKRVNYSVTFRLTPNRVLDDAFWDSVAHVSIYHERLLTSDKLVGECTIPIRLAKTAGISQWFGIRYKGEERGSLKLHLEFRNMPQRPASITVARKLGSDTAVDSQTWRASGGPRTHHSDAEPINPEIIDLLGIGKTPETKVKRVSFASDKDSRQTSLGTPPSVPKVATDWPQ